VYYNSFSNTHVLSEDSLRAALPPNGIFVMLLESFVNAGAKGLRNIQLSPATSEFCFSVGNSLYPCPSYVADFVSPRIARFHSIDPTINEFEISTPDPDIQFGQVLSLGHGEDLYVSHATQPFFLSIVSELENIELFQRVMKSFGSDATVSTIISRYCGLRTFSLPCDREAKFLASHFSELSSFEVAQLSHTDLERILSHPQLRVPDEDWLYRFVECQSENDVNSLNLFEFVRFEFVSVEPLIGRFVRLISEHYDCINLSIWLRICDRLVFDIESSHLQGKLLSFAFDEGNRLKGVIAYLTERYQGNVHDTGVVEITMNSTALHQPKCAADLTKSSYCSSLDFPNQWIEFNFKDRLIIPNHYSVKSAAGACLKSWVIEVSSDGHSWTEVDRQQDNYDLSGWGSVASYPIRNVVECHRIRLRQIAENQGNNHCLFFSGLELFGSLQE
jgi:hypothetical protein